MPRVLQWFGLLSLLILCAGTLGAWFTLRDRIQVVIQPLGDDVGAAAVDANELLRDELGEVRRDLVALAEHAAHLGEEIQRLGGELRAADVRATLAETRRAHGEQLRELATAVQELRGEVVGWKTALTAASPAEPTASVPARPPTEPLQPVPAGGSEAEVPQAEAKPLAAPPPAVPEPRKPFLSFRLPSQGFRFDGRQRFVVLPELSRVGFDAKSTLHDFSGVTSRITGEFTTDLGSPQTGCAGHLVVEAATLDTGLADRDAAMREHLACDQFAAIRFDLQAAENAAVDLRSQTVSAVAVGTITIRGKQRRLEMPVSLAIDAARRLVVEGQAKLRLTDFEVPVPNKLGLISMHDEVTVWLAVRARSMGPAGRESQERQESTDAR